MLQNHLTRSKCLLDNQLDRSSYNPRLRKCYEQSLLERVLLVLSVFY